MTKKLIILISVSAVIFLFIFSLGFVLIKKPRPEKQIYYPAPTIKRTYCFHPKTFPAPYNVVGGLPKI